MSFAVQKTLKHLSRFSLCQVLFFVAMVMILAAILTPIMFFSAQWIAHTFHSSLFQHYLGKGFFKFFDRARLVSAILCLGYFFRTHASKLRTFWTLQAFSWRSFSAVAIMSTVLFFVAYNLLRQQAYSLQPLSSDFILVKFLVAACIIAFLEEFLFRGVLCSFFEKDMPHWVVAILSSFIFASCHISGKVSWNIPADHVTIFSGFSCIFPALLAPWRSFIFINFFNLFLFGSCLYAIRYYFRSLDMCITYHGILVFFIMQLRHYERIFLLKEGQPFNASILDTWTTAILQIILLMVLYGIFRKKIYNHPSKSE